MIGTDATIVIVARIEKGVTMLEPWFAALANAVDADLVAALEFCKIFCNSYCNVLSFGYEELYRNTSNH